MSHNFWTTFNRGELAYCSDEEANLHKFDLRHEGQRFATNDVQRWVKEAAKKILKNVQPISRGKPVDKHTKVQIETAETQARAIHNCPKRGTFKALQSGPVFSRMISEYRAIFKELNQSWKTDMLASRLWEIHTGQRNGQLHITGKGNRRIYLEILGILMTCHDKRKLASLLFNMTIEEACNMNAVTLDAVLEDLFNIRTGVDGRGEVLHALLFVDQHWLPGTDAQDAENDDGKKKTSVKQYKGPSIGMRMGASGYNKSYLCRALDVASVAGKWPQIGETTYRTGITKEMITSHRSFLDELCKKPINGHIKSFEDHLNDEFHDSERALGTHYVCFYTKNELRARRLEDTKAVGATKNDFLATPSDLYLRDLRGLPVAASMAEPACSAAQ